MNTHESNFSLTIKEGTEGLSLHDVGHVRVGAVDVYKTSVGSMDNNCYFLVDTRAPENSVLIDASNDADHLVAVAKQLNTEIRTIITTHSHGDHVQALSDLTEEWAKYGVQHITSALDAADIEAATGIGADRTVTQGDTIVFGESATLNVSICRGHTKGGACLALVADSDAEPTHIFVGDCLFPGGIGATKKPEEFTQLLDDVTRNLFDTYPDDTKIHPGHGNGTTLGAERPQLGEWRVRGW